MAVLYEHTQRGTLMLVVFGIAVIGCATAAVFIPGPARWLDLAIALGCLILAWLFSSLTVSVRNDELSWYFGPGAWTYRLPRSEIEGVRVVRNSVLNGFGIRMGYRFRLYNVSGLDAVELLLKDGETRRIGTDDPAGLAAALGR